MNIEDLKRVLTEILTKEKEHTLELIELANRVQKVKLFKNTVHSDIVAAIKKLMGKEDTVKQSTIIKAAYGREEIMVRLIDGYVSPLAENVHEEVTKLSTGKVTLPKNENPHQVS